MHCRYRRLYNAAIKDKALTYAWFFIFYLIHIAFCVWSAISPPLPGANDWSHTGFIACLKAFKASKFVGVLYAIGGALWTIESLWSLWVMKTVTFFCLMCIAYLREFLNSTSLSIHDWLLFASDLEIATKFAAHSSREQFANVSRVPDTLN